MVIYKSVKSTEFMWCLWVAVAFNLAAGGFLVHLIAFHINLKHKGITTYEYILEKSNRSKSSKIVILKGDLTDLK